MTVLELKLDGSDALVAVDTVIIAGWTGRDRAAVEQHMAELEALGVPRPSSAPVFYRVSASRLTTDREIESTPASSGEVEAVLLRHGGKLWVGVGSDHTDREVETYSVAVSKQLCDKPLASDFWPYDEVIDHWDQLKTRSWIGHGQVLYQDGGLDELLHPEELKALAEPSMRDGTVRRVMNLYGDGYIYEQGIASSTRFPRDQVDAMRAGLVGLPPRMLLQRLGVLDGMPVVDRPEGFAPKRIGLIAGPEDPAHTREIEERTLELLRTWGAEAELIWLADRGIAGNGYFLMFEENSDDILEVVAEQIAAVGPGSAPG